MPNPRRSPAHPHVRALGLLAVLALAVVGCSEVGNAREKAIAAVTEGDWDCTPANVKAGDPLVIEAHDGDFEIRSPDHPKDGPATGSWKVVDKKVSLRIGLDDGKELLDVRGFDDLDAKAGTITVQDPEDAGERATFEVDVKGTDTIAIAPKADSSDQFPSGTWTCERR